MDYHLLLDTAMDIAYQLAMGGAETYRIEESIKRILSAYGASAEVFAIPNSMMVTMTAPDGECITRMRRIGFHANDMDRVERFSNLSRKICTACPHPDVAAQWLHEMTENIPIYKFPMYLLANLLSGVGFCVFFGGSTVDAIVAGLCSVLIGFVSHFMNCLKVNPFFTTIAASFVMAFAAYTFGTLPIGCNPDLASIGALMVLVPGLLFTNALRDIIFGDTNSGINRIVQVLLVAAALALGTGTALNLTKQLFGTQACVYVADYSVFIECIASAVGCLGLSLLFNIRGKGILLCLIGGIITWGTYSATFTMTANPNIANFIATVIAAVYSEVMARVRHCPAISYLITAIFPLIPGAGIYYTARCLAENDMVGFAAEGSATISCAGAIAVGILIVSTLVRHITIGRQMKKK